jgi:phenylacetate-CoA ligase
MSPRTLESRWDRRTGPDIRRRQGRQLARYLAGQVVPFSRFYRELFAREKLRPDQFRTLDDLRRLPFTSKKDLLNTPEHPERARDFVLIPDPGQLARRPAVMVSALLRGKARTQAALAREYRPIFLTSTTGRSAEPVPFLFSGYDVDNLTRSGRRLVAVLGSPPDGRLLNMFPFAPHLAFWQTHYAVIGAGVFAVSTGGGKVMGTEGNIRLMKKLKPSGLIGMPTFLYHVLQQAHAEGVRCDSLQSLVLGGEKVPDGMRRKLKTLAEQIGGRDVSVVSTYGFTEAKMAWGECPYPLDRPSGGYHLYPDLGVIEVIDPATGEPQPEGHPGELVFTPLDSRGSVVLRYRTGDFIDGGLVYEPCPYCRRQVARLVGKISRQSSVQEMRLDPGGMHLGKVKGTLIDFNDMEHVLDNLEQVGAWQIELRKVNDDPLDLDELVLHVVNMNRVPEDQLIQELNTQFVRHFEFKPNRIVFQSAEEMQRRHGVGQEIKEKRVVDNRPRG